MKSLIRFRNIPSSSASYLQVVSVSITMLLVMILQGCATPTGGDYAKWKPADPLQVGHEDPSQFIHSVRIDEKGKAFAKVSSPHMLPP